MDAVAVRPREPREEIGVWMPFLDEEAGRDVPGRDAGRPFGLPGRAAG